MKRSVQILSFFVAAVLSAAVMTSELQAAVSKLSAIASGGAYNPATDTLVGVRSGTTDQQFTLSAGSFQTPWTSNINGAGFHLIDALIYDNQGTPGLSINPLTRALYNGGGGHIVLDYSAIGHNTNAFLSLDGSGDLFVSYGVLANYFQGDGSLLTNIQVKYVFDGIGNTVVAGPDYLINQSDGDAVIDLNDQILQNDNFGTAINWSGIYTGDPLSFNGGNAVFASPIQNPLGNDTIDTSNSILFNHSSGNTIDWTENYNSSAALSFDGNRPIFQGNIEDTGENTSINVNDRALFDSSGNDSVDWNTRFLVDSAGKNTVDFEAHKVIATDGTTTIIDYSSLNGPSFGGGHIASTGTAPGVASCGTGSPSISGTDTKGVITTGTAATSCTVNFHTSFSSAPVCTMSTSSTASVGDISSVGTGSVVFGLSVALTAGKIYYHCIQ